MSEVRSALTKKVKLSVSVIGVGHAGGQIVQSLPKEYKSFIINSSEKDLDPSILKSSIPSFIIGNEGRGAGKSRALAKKLLKINGREIFKNETFSNMITSSDIVFIVGAMAGGTGSGIAPDLINLLKKIYPNTIFIYYGILPKLSDSYQAQQNTVECFKEISLSHSPYMLADLQVYANQDQNIAYQKIGEHVRQCIEFASGKDLNYSESGMIDENDMRMILSAEGYMAFYTVTDITQEMMDQKSIQEMLIDQIRFNCAVKIARDGAIGQMGIVINTTDSAQDKIRSGDYDELIRFLGRPFSIFENYSHNADGAVSSASLILSEMSDPEPRILEIYKILENPPKRRKIYEKEVENLGIPDRIQNLLNQTKPDKKDVESTLDEFFN